MKVKEALQIFQKLEMEIREGRDTLAIFTKEFISITTFTCQFCHSGLSRILLFSERFPTSGNDRCGFTYGLISKWEGKIILWSKVPHKKGELKGKLSYFTLQLQ